MAHIPSYRKQRERNGKDRAFVEIGGVRRYLGPYGSAESREAYARAIAEWTSGGGHLPVEAQQITVAELAARYWTFAEGYYRKDGESTGELCWVRYALQPLLALDKGTPAKGFGPLKLKTVRARIIKSGVRRRTADGRVVRVNLSRRTANGRIDRIKRMFRWGTENELVGAGVYEALRAVAGLRKGRSEARETAPIRAVPIEDVLAVIPFVTAPVAAMIEVQLHTGSRLAKRRTKKPAPTPVRVKPKRARPIRDLEKTIRDGIPGYDPYDQAGDCVFDVKAAKRAIRFFESELCHVKGEKARTPFLLERWQQAVIGNLFGWKRPDGTRRYRQCLIFVPRKNGKTPMAAVTRVTRGNQGR